jgi:hypothetical protein
MRDDDVIERAYKKIRRRDYIGIFVRIAVGIFGFGGLILIIQIRNRQKPAETAVSIYSSFK